MTGGKGANPQLARLCIEILKQLGIAQQVADSFSELSEEERYIKQVKLYGEVFREMYGVLAQLGGEAPAVQVVISQKAEEAI